MPNNINRGHNNYWSEDDLVNLKKVIQIMEQYLGQLKDLNNAQKGYIKDAVQRNKLDQEYETQLNKLGYSLSQLNNLDNYEETYRIKSKELLQQKAINEFEKELGILRSSNDKETIKYKKEINSYYDEAVEKIKEISRKETDVNKLQKEVDKIAAKVNEKEQARTKIYKEQQEQLQKQKQIEENKKRTPEKNARDINRIFGTNIDIASVESGTSLWNAAISIFAKAVDEFKQAVTGGINKNYNTTEQVLNSIVASNAGAYNLSWSRGNFSFGGRNYSGFSKINNAITDQLSQDKLLNNINNTDVMNAVSSLTSTSGYSLENAIAKGYRDTVIKYIVPYLDTSSEAYNLLELRLPGISQDIAAINISQRTQNKENEYLSKYSSQLVELMQPVALNANKQLYSETYQKIAAQAQALYPYMSPEEIQKLVNQAFEMYNSPYPTLKNGSISEKMALINTMQQGQLDNPQAYFENLITGADTAYQQIGSNNAMDRSIIQNAWGLPGIRNNWTGIHNELINPHSQFTNPTVKSEDALNNIYNNTVAQADNFNTTQQKIDALSTNQTKDLGDIKNYLSPTITNILTTGFDAIIAFLGGKFLIALGKSKLGTSVASIIAGGTSGTATATAGGVAIAAGTVAALAAAVIAGNSLIADKLWSKSGNKGLSDAEAKLDGTALAGNSAATALYGATFASAHANGFQKRWGNVGAGISYGFSNLFQNNSNKNKNKLQWFIQSNADENVDQDTKAKNLLAMAMIYAQSGQLDAFNKGLQEAGINTSINSNEDIGAMIKEMQIPKTEMQSRVNSLFKAGWGQIATDSSKKKISGLTIDGSKFGLEGVLGYRQGLDEVPYDNFPALLHEGEAVLTASTANELRNLLDDYRSSNEQSINLDAIIQQQTTTLCSKLDEVIQAVNMSKLSGYISTSTQLQQKGRELFSQRFARVENTKGF